MRYRSLFGIQCTLRCEFCDWEIDESTALALARIPGIGLCRREYLYDEHDLLLRDRSRSRLGNWTRCQYNRIHYSPCFSRSLASLPGVMAYTSLPRPSWDSGNGYFISGIHEVPHKNRRPGRMSSIRMPFVPSLARSSQPHSMVDGWRAYLIASACFGWFLQTG